MGLPGALPAPLPHFSRSRSHAAATEKLPLTSHLAACGLFPSPLCFVITLTIPSWEDFACNLLFLDLPLQNVIDESTVGFAHPCTHAKQHGVEGVVGTSQTVQ